jgi:hypothetical protein
VPRFRLAGRFSLISDPPFSPPFFGIPLPSFSSYRDFPTKYCLCWIASCGLQTRHFRIPGHLLPSLPPWTSLGLNSPHVVSRRRAAPDSRPSLPPSSAILLLHSSTPLSRSLMISHFATSVHVVSGCHAFNWLADSCSFPTRPSLLHSLASPFLPSSRITFPNEISSRCIASCSPQIPRFQLVNGVYSLSIRSPLGNPVCRAPP